MKKIISFILLAAIGLGIYAYAAGPETTNGVGASVGTSGGVVNGGAAIQYGVNPGAQSVDVIPLLAAVSGSKGDALVLVSPRSCSKTTTAGDPTFIGFAGDDYTYGDIVKVVRRGMFACRIGTSTTVNDMLVTSANPGFLTPAAAVTAANYTSVSGTPIAARAFVTYTYVTYSPTVLVIR
jgi:hypothetical protein